MQDYKVHVCVISMEFSAVNHRRPRAGREEGRLFSQATCLVPNFLPVLHGQLISVTHGLDTFRLGSRDPKNDRMRRN